MTTAIPQPPAHRPVSIYEKQELDSMKFQDLPEKDAFRQSTIPAIVPDKEWLSVPMDQGHLVIHVPHIVSFGDITPGKEGEARISVHLADASRRVLRMNSNEFARLIRRTD